MRVLVCLWFLFLFTYSNCVWMSILLAVVNYFIWCACLFIVPHPFQWLRNVCAQHWTSRSHISVRLLGTVPTILSFIVELMAFVSSYYFLAFVFGGFGLATLRCMCHQTLTFQILQGVQLDRRPMQSLVFVRCPPFVMSDAMLECLIFQLPKGATRLMKYWYRRLPFVIGLMQQLHKHF